MHDLNRSETLVHVAGVKKFYRGMKESLVIAAVVLAVEVGFLASNFLSMFFCPVWIVASLLKDAIERPGWALALARIGIPALTYLLVTVNKDFQNAVAETNAQRIVSVCEEFRAANDKFPRSLDELVPQYLNSVPVAKYCLGPGSRFIYTSGSGPTMLWWEVVPPHYRKLYNFETRKWGYVD